MKHIPNTQSIMEKAFSFKAKLLEYRRHLHSHPEIGLSLPDTKAYVKEQLIHLGYSPQDCGTSGIVALAGNRNKGKIFLLRADMDGLPIAEKTDVAFAATNGNMHACGHDMHTAMLLGAAALLKEYEDELCGTVKLMFEPGEEVMAGAKDMITHGVLENPSVDAGMMIHVMSGVSFPVGTAITAPCGISAPACDNFTIEIQGKGGHGSMPELAIDPILVGCQIHTAIQTILSRELSLSDQAVLTIGSFQAGSVGNVIPDSATLQGTLRTMDEEVRSYIKERLLAIVTATAATFRANATLTFTSGCPTLRNDAETQNTIYHYLLDLLGPNMALASNASASENTKAKSTGSEDFAYVSQKIPTIMIALAAGSPKDGHNFNLHHPKVTFDEEALPYGSAIFAYSAIRWLAEHKD